MKEIKFDNKEIKFLKELLSNSYDKKAAKIIKKLNNAEKKIKTSSMKAKGRALQYWVCRQIADIFGVDFVQSDDECLIHSREMGQHGTDIILRGWLSYAFPYDVECKNCETLSIPKWVEQAKKNQQECREWLLIFKKQSMGNQPYVVMEWNSFEKLMRECTNENKNHK